MKLTWTGDGLDRQATKHDLTDIARALGVDLTRQASYSVITLRALIRARLEALTIEGKLST